MLDLWSDTRVINQLNSGSKWSGSVISYAFPSSSSGITTSSGEGSGFRALNTTQQRAAELALFTWDDLIRPDFFKVTERANIEYGMSNSGVEFAHAYYPQAGSVWFNYTYQDLANPVLGERGFATYIHETGHALGLDHMGDYNGAGDWNPSAYQDSTVYTVMSYFGPSDEAGEGQVAWGDWVGRDGVLYAPQTPMLNDILAIQSMYGLETTREGDTVYGFNSNISGELARIYDFEQNANPILCIYDSGGIDSLDLSGWSTNSEVSLIAGTFSSCNDMTNNLSIARGVFIENAYTGSSRDSLTGNEVNNRLNAGAGNDQLSGGGGDDILIGGLGVDTAVYANAVTNYTISYNNQTLEIADLTTNRDGVDQLYEIESIKFGRATWNINYQSGAEGLSTQTLVGNWADYRIQTDGGFAAVFDTVQSRGQLQLTDGIERLQLNDSMVALDIGIGQTAGQAYRLYQAAFDRTPDQTGLGYWISELDRGTSLLEIASGFMGVQEFKTMYGNDPTDQTFLTLLYQHVFDREPDNAGYNYWQGLLNNGTQRAHVLSLFSESAENFQNVESQINVGIQYQLWGQL